MLAALVAPLINRAKNKRKSTLKMTLSTTPVMYKQATALEAGTDRSLIFPKHVDSSGSNWLLAPTPAKYLSTTIKISTAPIIIIKIVQTIQSDRIPLIAYPRKRMMEPTKTMIKEIKLKTKVRILILES